MKTKTQQPENKYANKCVDFETARKLKELKYDGEYEFFYYPDYNKSKPLDTEDKFQIHHKDSYLSNDITIQQGYEEGLFQLVIPLPFRQEVIEWLDSKGILIFISPSNVEIEKEGDDVNYEWKIVINSELEIISGKKRAVMRTDEFIYGSRKEAELEAIKEGLRIFFYLPK